ncbi:restriction endonuclease subunit S [Acinetobacter baumannii]|uniref:restriction endonuclease subunit S n=1 Tax=Acinetobacter baumannii TaxID=470 RepID=UPI0038914CE3
MAKYQKYAEYQDSGIEWLGEIPNSWQVKKLKYLCKVTTGNKDTVNAVEDGKYPFFVRSQTVERINSIGADCEAVLTAGDGVGVGKVYHYYKGKFDFHQRVYMLYDFGDVIGRFVYYYLSSNFYKVALEGNAKSTVDSLRLPQFLNFAFSLPTIKEQDWIVDFLDHEIAKIDTLIAKQEKLIELLKEKRQAVISHAVTKGLNPNVPMKDSGVEWLGEVPEHWNMAPVRRYLVEHRQGYYTTESYVDEGLKLLRITDLRDLGEINISNCPMVNESDTTHLFKLQKGDVVFARTGGAGSFGVITEDYENLIYASYLIRFRFMNKIFEPDYLRFLFQSDSFQLSVKQNIHGGVNQNIHAEDIKNTVICAPSLSEQKEIIEYLENQCLLFENLIYKASYSVKLMQERRTALISAAVTGKIDVRNWQAPTLAEADTELSA